MNKAAACVHIDVLFEQKYDLFDNIEEENQKNQMDKELTETKIRTDNEFQGLERFFDKINDFYNPLVVLKDRALKQLNCPVCIDCFNEPIVGGNKENDSMMPRLYVCAICLYVGCFKFKQPCHISLHSQQREGHSIYIDLDNGYMYCVQCRDYQYNQTLEDLFIKCRNRTNTLAFGKFQEWEPSQKTLRLLKCFADHSKSKPKAEETRTTDIQESCTGDTFELFKIKSSSIIGLRGLLNLGNTCFMNCILQTFTHTPTLRDYFLSDKHVCLFNKNPYQNQSRRATNNTTSDYCLVCELVVLFQEFYSGKRSIHIPFHLLYQVWTAMKHLAGYEQQDAHEFFIAALNSLHKNCIENDEECISLNKLDTTSTNYNNCHCIIDKIFTGGLQSDVNCSNCDYVSTKVDPFWDISLDLGNNLAKNEEGVGDSLKLEDCLLRFTLPETLNHFNCSLCKSTNDAKKQLTMKNLPIVCCFHLKRFEHSNKIHKKISTHISFPEILDMSPFMSKKTTPEQKAHQAESNKYFLFAVVNHHGTLESGHYTSFIRLTHDQWFDCDDHIIKNASIQDVMNSEGYLLFYHKIWNEFP